MAVTRCRRWAIAGAVWAMAATIGRAAGGGRRAAGGRRAVAPRAVGAGSRRDCAFSVRKVSKNSILRAENAKTRRETQPSDRRAVLGLVEGAQRGTGRPGADASHGGHIHEHTPA